MDINISQLVENKVIKRDGNIWILDLAELSEQNPESMKEFEEPFKKNIPNISSIPNNKVPTGGSFSKKNSKKYKGKSKKVRFAL